MMINLGFLFLYIGLGLVALALFLGGQWLLVGLMLALCSFAVSIVLGIWRVVVLLEGRK